MRPGGYDDYDDGFAASPPGRASVGGVAGRATVGRASVGGPPGGPPGGDLPGGRPPGGRKPGRKKSRRRNIILASVAVFIMLSGLIVVGGTYYFDSVPLPSQLTLPESTTIFYSDGTTPMAKLGNENRTVLPDDQIPMDLKHAVVAAEDNTFYTNSGVDFKGILRAAWNNVTGGDRQGASTITQQYARKVADLTGISYARKIREAVIAMKLDQKYTKDQIVSMYLNLVYLGRGANGAEAAAEAYFGKHASQLTVAEDMVLADLNKQPEPDPNDPKGSPGYDPGISPVSLQNAKDRWEYTKKNMVKLGFMKPDVAATLQFPMDFLPNNGDASAAQFGLDKPTGNVVHHVMDELSNMATPVPNLKTGGYRIITTIDKTMEDAAIAAASPSVKTSVLSQQTSGLQSGLVAIKPGTGEVMAYYGGDNGANLDYAGIYADPVLSDGTYTGASSQPGSTFKVYTLATALKQGISIDSYWDGPPSKSFPDRPANKPVTNADGAGDSCPKADGYQCPLWQALQQSMNTVFYGVGYQVKAANIIDTAKALGIRWLWDQNSKRIDLSKMTGAQAMQQYSLGTEVSIGQYATTVLDQASAISTIAARGVQVQTHFVKQVLKGSTVVYQPPFKANELYKTFGLTQAEIDDETWAMQKVVQPGGTGGKDALANGRPAAAKTGTWEYNTTGENSNAWFNGFTAPGANGQTALATSVWVGHAGNPGPLRWHNPGSTASNKMSGGDTPGAIWKKFMDTVLKGKANAKFADPKHVGDPTAGNGHSPAPSVPPADPNQNNNQNQNPNPTNTCLIPGTCVTTSPTQNRGPGGGGGGGGAGGG